MTLPAALVQRSRRDPSGFVYDGFISYSHAVDRGLARALQRILHRLGRRWYRRAALRVFRDDTALAASASLADAIRRAMRQSRTFVLLASPESASSDWVRQEVAFWRGERSAETFFVVVTDGELVWDNDAGDFDWDRTTALSEHQLTGWFRQEPLWVDLRGNRDRRQRREFRLAAATVAAAIHGVPKDDLLSEDARQQRRLVSVLSVLLVFVLVGASVAVWQWNVATTQRDRADQQMRTAVAGQLVSQSLDLGAADPTAARLESLAAWGIDPTAEARYAMLTAEALPVRSIPTTPGDAVTKVGFSSDGNVLVTDTIRGAAAQLWDVATGHQIAQLGGLGNLKNFSRSTNLRQGIGPVSDVALSPVGRTVATDVGGTVRLWDMATGHQIGQLIGDTAEAISVTFSPDGKTLATTGLDNTVRLWDVITGRQIGQLASGQRRYS